MKAFAQNSQSLVEEIHFRAVELASRYRKAEADLIDVIQRVDLHRVFLKMGYPTLFEYAVQALRLSESISFNLISIARKAREIPELKSEIKNGSITLSNARKIVPVLTPENKQEWLSKARNLSHRELEREVVRVRPEEATRERATYVAFERLKLEIGLSEKNLLALRQVQNILSQKSRRAVSLEETITIMTQEFLDRYDPVEKAKRQTEKKPVPQKEPAPENTPMPKNMSQSVALQAKQTRQPIPQALVHQVNLRDQRRCTHLLPNGLRCNQARWLEVHHKIPVSEGGTNALENLTTLCSAHHKYTHLRGSTCSDTDE